jgi:hypothetical protein
MGRNIPGPHTDAQTIKTQPETHQLVMRTKPSAWPIVAAAAATFLLTGCIPSVFPFYTERDLVSNPRLIGRWEATREAEELRKWEFEPGPATNYLLSVTDREGKAGRFNARLFRLRDATFLDLSPSECAFATNQTDLVACSVFPGHLLVRVEETDPGLKLAFFDFDWLGKYLQEHPAALAHHREDDRIVLTAGTADLQRFVLDHLAEGQLFDTPIELARQAARKP